MVGVDDFIAGSAITLGISQMMLRTLNADDYTPDSDTYRYLYMGILANILWLTYQYRKGANYSAMYSILGLFSQLFILYKVSSTERSREKQI